MSKKLDLQRFLDQSRDGISSTELKLTYVGPQEKATPTVGIVPEGKAFDLNIFRSLRSSGINYGNDDVATPEVCVLTSSDYQEIYTTIMEHLKKSTEMPDRPFLSISVVQFVPGIIGTEVLLDRNQSEQLLKALVSKVSQLNRDAYSTLETFRTRIL